MCLVRCGVGPRARECESAREDMQHCRTGALRVHTLHCAALWLGWLARPHRGRAPRFLVDQCAHARLAGSRSAFLGCACVTMQCCVCEPGALPGGASGWVTIHTHSVSRLRIAARCAVCTLDVGIDVGQSARSELLSRGRDVSWHRPPASGWGWPRGRGVT